MISMKTLSLALLAFSTASFAAPEFFGPMPHERTDTPRKAKANIGRYMYVGTAPGFNGDEIELTVAKMSLTLRATGWMKQERIDNYSKELYQRWEKIDETLQDPNFVLHPLVKLMSLPTKDTSIAWAKIAAQYSDHVLENRGVEVYNSKRNAESLQSAGIEVNYRENISKAILRYFFNDNSLTPDTVKSDNRLRDRLLSVQSSRGLFQIHHKDSFKSSSDKAGYVGNITLVYPVAATTAGPFDQPAEGVRQLMNYGTINARWWSDKWQDEFGGLPFILINKSGVAFHGPITNFNPLDVWYLRRGYVSHGCHRMDVSDIMELRSMLPTDIKQLGKVKITVLNNFDVIDFNQDGQPEVVDVKYYNVPSAVSIPQGKKIDDVIAPYLVQNQMKSFYSTHAYAKKFYDASTDKISGAPKYKVVNGSLVKDGTHGPLSIQRFEYPKTRVLQYKELGTQFLPYDDNRGKYPPIYFLD